MGAEGVKVPAQTQPLPGQMQVRDLISDNVRISVSGKNVRVTGNIKRVREEWIDFDASGDNTGHFFPMVMPEVCKGHDITVTGRVKGDRTVKITDDLLLISRLENLSGDTMAIKMDGDTLMAVDFSKAAKDE